MSAHFHRNVVICFLCLLLLGLFLSYAPCSLADGLPSVYEYSNILFDSILVGEDSYISTDQKLNMQDNGQDYTNYWMQASIAAGYVADGNLEDAREIVENLMGTFQRNASFPRPVYNQFAYGWVSCMDAPTVAIAALMLYERTGNKEYLQFVSELSNYMTRDVTDGGFITNIGSNQIWAFEYANKDTTKENGLFVLNGSLLGVLEMEIVARVTDNNALHQTACRAYESIKQKMEEYWYKNDTWCYYMLNELRVNPPLYYFRNSAAKSIDQRFRR